MEIDKDKIKQSMQEPFIEFTLACILLNIMFWGLALLYQSIEIDFSFNNAPLTPSKYTVLHISLNVPFDINKIFGITITIFNWGEALVGFGADTATLILFYYAMKKRFLTSMGRDKKKEELKCFKPLIEEDKDQS